MKEWKKPEIVDLDVKYTENAPVTISGGVGSCNAGWDSFKYVNINGQTCQKYTCKCGLEFYNREDAKNHQPLPTWPIPWSN